MQKTGYFLVLFIAACGGSDEAPIVGEAGKGDTVSQSPCLCSCSGLTVRAGGQGANARLYRIDNRDAESCSAMNGQPCRGYSGWAFFDDQTLSDCSVRWGDASLQGEAVTQSPFYCHCVAEGVTGKINVSVQPSQGPGTCGVAYAREAWYELEQTSGEGEICQGYCGFTFYEGQLVGCLARWGEPVSP